MSDLPRVYTVEPLVPISDDDLTYRARFPHWTMTEALFLLSGHKPPGYESTRHMQDHFWAAYHVAMLAIEKGEICQKIERAGERVFIDSPARWFAWADNLGPKYIKVDERVCRAIQGRRGRRAGKNSSFPKTADQPAKKRGGGRKRGRYYGPLKRHLEWRKGAKNDLDTASLKDLREDAQRRLITDMVRDIPKSRSTFEDAIKDVLKTLDVDR